MKFIGRDAERKRLLREFSSNGQNATLVYGRRRVGKSELILQCLRESHARSIYYECKQTTEQDNLASLSQVLASAFDLPSVIFPSIEALLNFVFERAENEKVILVLDEYPYLRDAVKGMDSILQASIDRHRDSSKASIVLCGSFVEVMRSLLEKDNPLYGRMDLSIDLKPMDYFDAAQFYPSFSNEDKVRLYSVLGGIPHYNKMVDAGGSVRENIIDLIASPGARLENEISMYLLSEISKITNANEIFGALSQGYSRYKDILVQSHVSSGPSMIDTLDKLIKMELVQKQAPINDPGNKRRAGYVIIDPLSNFYYRYVFRYSSQMTFLNSDTFYERYIDQDFETRYVPHAFEEICRQHLIRQNKVGRIDPPFDLIGRYYYDDPATRTNGEFDVVTRDPNGYIFYEAKFRNRPIDANIVEKEIEQVERTGLSCYRYGFFSRSGFTAESSDRTIFIDLDDMY